MHGTCHILDNNHKPAVSKGPHRTMHIQHGDMEADVDEQIAPLIIEMWRAGIETWQSCQANPSGWVWLQFPTSIDAEKFLNIVAFYEPVGGLLHERMRYGYDRLDCPRPGQWQYVVVADDLAAGEIETEAGDIEQVQYGPPDIVVLVSLHIPVGDLPTMLERVKAHNQGRFDHMYSEHPIGETGSVQTP